jgi:hypothetical protein
MTHVLGDDPSEEELSGLNEWLWKTLNFGIMFGQLLVSKTQNNFKIRNKIYSPYLYLTTREKFAPLYTSPDLAHNFLSDQLWLPLLYNNSKQQEFEG